MTENHEILKKKQSPEAGDCATGDRGDMGDSGDTGDTGLTVSTVLRHEIKPKMGEISNI